MSLIFFRYLSTRVDKKARDLITKGFEECWASVSRRDFEKLELKKLSESITVKAKNAICPLKSLKLNDIHYIHMSTHLAEMYLLNLVDTELSNLTYVLHDVSDDFDLRSSYVIALQEFVEAITFMHFCKNRNLLPRSQINEYISRRFPPNTRTIKISTTEYLLGVADLTGELLKLSKIQLEHHDLESFEEIYEFVVETYKELTKIFVKFTSKCLLQKMMQVVRNIKELSKALKNYLVTPHSHLLMAGAHIVGYPRIGPKRELKFALESFWAGKSTPGEMEKVAADLKSSIWKHMADSGINFIPSNTFSYYDQVLDTTAMLGAVPPRFKWDGGEIGFSTYFLMARGNASVHAMEMAKWFDTNYYFVVPELGPDVKFSYASHKAVNEYREAQRLGIDTVPVLCGPVSYLLLSKPAKGVEKTFPLLSLLDKILPIYKEVIADLKTAGAKWIQFDEPTLVLDLESHQLEAFTKAYTELESSVAGLNVLVETYFADVPLTAFKTLTSLSGVTGFGFDLIHGTKTIDLIEREFPSGKFLFAGVVDGRNIWANDLNASLITLQSLVGIVGEGRLIVSTSCSLLHTAVDLANEKKLDIEMKSWLAFAAQKVMEVRALANALAGNKDEAFFAAAAAARDSRKSSPLVTNEAVQKAVTALKGSDHRRATHVSARLDAQQKKLNLPVLPTTTIGSFPVTQKLRKLLFGYLDKKISEEERVKAIKVEINELVRLQEDLDIDVLVHGELEWKDIVTYFGEKLSGFATTSKGWVQSYGSVCPRPLIIYGDVSRPNPMTVFWSTATQSMTKRPIKGILAGPLTILNSCFVRDDQPRFETCYQIALAIKDEVEDLEKAGITVIQINEAALRGLPLRKAEHAFYLDWAAHSFRITNCGVQDTTQIHTHMCYSKFNDNIHFIIDMDADVITIENSQSDEKLLSVFREGVKYRAGIGPGVYDIHSPGIPSTEEIIDRINKMLAVLDANILWVNPDCGLKTCNYGEVKLALANMVSAAKLLRAQLASAK